jgi:hypothetical protein
MKKAMLFLLLLFASFGTAQTTPDEYNITVHVRSSYIVYGNGGSSQYLDVVIEGKKFQLADPNNGYLLALGDYKAKLVKDDHKTPYESIRMYEFQFPDKKTRKFAVAGQSE